MANIPEPVTPGFPPVYQLELEDDVIGGPGGTANRQGEKLVERTAYLKKTLEQEIVDRGNAEDELQGQLDSDGLEIAANASAINAMKGRGGYLMAHDFGTATPSQAELNAYALTQIHSDDPNDIWNGTHVKNIYVDPATIDVEHPNGIPNNHVWALTNTPDTVPPIFEWVDDGFDSVSVSGENLLGLVTGSPASEEGGVQVNPVTGKMSIILPTGLAAANSLDFIAKSRPFIVATGKKQVTIKRRTYIPIEISGVEHWYKADTDEVLNVESLLDTGATLQAGKDYKIFIVWTGTDLEIKVSLSDVPDGFTVDTVRMIGGFHTLCVSAGTGMSYTLGGNQFDHLLNGFSAGDILPYSAWCLNHRPYSDPAGMVYIPNLDFWCDIYLQSGTGATTKSAYQGAITRTRQYVDFVEDQFCVNKALLNDEEFASAMLGSNEKTAVAGSSESGATTGGAGGRMDTANRRMLSVYGVEEGCGSLWQWLATTSAAGSSGWTTQNGGKGDFYGACYVLLAGGDWCNAAYCGSRARDAYYSRANASANVGGRGRSRAIRL
jgi:hypothetical protein